MPPTHSSDFGSDLDQLCCRLVRGSIRQSSFESLGEPTAKPNGEPPRDSTIDSYRNAKDSCEEKDGVVSGAIGYTRSQRHRSA